MPFESHEMCLCRVCGDFANRYHFKQLICNACRAFFHRSEDEKYKMLMCRNNGACVINLKNRRYCAHCRYKKCLEIGMTKDKCADALCTTYNMHICSVSSLNTDQYEEIQSIAMLFEEKYKFGSAKLITALPRLHQQQRKVQTTIILKTLLDCNYSFFCSLCRVCELPENAKVHLLENTFLDSFNIAFSLLFDKFQSCWDLSSKNVMLNLELDYVVSSVDHCDLFGIAVTQKRLELMHSLLKTNSDEVMLLLFFMVSLFSLGENHRNASFSAPILNARGHFEHLLELYLNQKYGLLKSKRVYNKLFSLLRQVRKLSQLMYRLKWILTDDERNQVDAFTYNLCKQNNNENNIPMDLTINRYRPLECADQ